MSRRVISVIGAGNGGQAMAAYFAIAGCETRIFDFFEKPIKRIKELGYIELEGAIEGKGDIAVASNDIAEVLKDTDLIMVVNPAIYHNKIAKACAPYIREGDKIFLNPSSVFGAFAFKKALEDQGCHKKVTIAESNTLLFTARLIEDGKVHIGGKKDRLLVSSFPSCDKEKIYDIIRPVIKELEECNSVLETSFDSTNAMVHPLPTIMNASWTESGKKFRYYLDGIGSTVGHFIEGMDKERVDIAEKLGLVLGKDLFSLFLEYKIEYETEAETISEVLKSVDAYRDIMAAPTVKTRYIYEDVPTGLVPFIAVGELLGMPVSKMQLVQDLCEAMLNEDFTNCESSRNLDNLGLAGMTADEIVHYAQTGEK